MRRKRIGQLAPMMGLAAVAAVLLGLVVVPPGSAGAESFYTGPIIGTPKILRLHTAATGVDRFFLEGSTDANAVDVIGNAKSPKCELRLNGQGNADRRIVAGHLVTITAFQRDIVTGDQTLAPAAGWSVGFSATENSIGVASESSSNQKCAEVNERSPGEVLSIKLNSGPTTLVPEIRGYLFTRLELDLQAKFDPQFFYYSLYLNGAGVPTQSQVEIPLCPASVSDCGPDSLTGDDYRVQIPQPDETGQLPSLLFDEVRIWPASNNGVVGNGSVGLKGGADGTAPWRDDEGELGLAEGLFEADEVTVTNDSLFELVKPAEGLLGCGGSATTFTDAETGPSTADLFRRENTDEGSTCEPKPYNLESSIDTQGNSVIMFEQGAVEDQASAHFFMEITWEGYEPITDPTTTSTATIAGRTILIQYGEADDPHPGQLCTDVSYEDGVVLSATHPLRVDPGHVGEDEDWCITGQAVTIDQDGLAILVQQWDGVGDPKWR